jgi:hypothetical protein
LTRRNRELRSGQISENAYARLAELPADLAVLGIAEFSRALARAEFPGKGTSMVITLIGYLLLALSILAVLTFCWLTASCFKVRTRSSDSGTGSLATTVGMGHQK